MKKTNETQLGPDKTKNGPKAMKDVINEYFSGGQPLAVPTASALHLLRLAQRKEVRYEPQHTSVREPKDKAG